MLRAIRLVGSGVLLLALCTPLQLARADDWPQWLGPQRDGVWRESGILEKFPAGGPKKLWRTPVGMGYSGPAVVGDRVYLTDRLLPEGTKNPTDAFAVQSVPGTERVLCLDAKDGSILWKHEYDCPYRMSYPAGPRTSPVVQGGKVYTLGAMGDLLCLDANKGKVLWSRNFPRDYEARVPLWGFAAHPLLDGDKLICLVGGKGGVAVAFHKDTGKELWHALEAKEIGYAPPMIFEAGGKRQLIIWHPEALNSLDPETGKLFWSQKFTSKANLSIPTPRKEGDLLFITSFYNGSLMMRLNADKPEATVVWKGKGRGERPDQTEGLHSIMSTPFFRDGYIYGDCSYGELRCLNALTGERVWTSLKATGSREEEEDRWANVFFILQGDRFFLPTEKGELIIVRLTPKGYEELDRAQILEPTNHFPGRAVVWSHPAFARRCMFARNDKELVCVSLAAP